MASVGIVGAGMAGLAAANTLEGLGHSVTIYEKGDAPGGRVKSHAIDGHIVDEGFQIYIDGYPTGRLLLDLDQLELKTFTPGSIVHSYGETFKTGDPIRSPRQLPQTIMSKVGTFNDKLKLLKLRKNLSKLPVQEIWKQSDLTASEFLESYDFSTQFTENFWRPLFSGITLDNELSGSANTLQFVFKMLSESNAVIPAKGMGQIPSQLASNLESSIHFNQTASKVAPKCITIDGRNEYFDAVIVATDRDTSNELCNILQPKHSTAEELDPSGWKSCVSIWFGAETAPTKDKFIHLGVGSAVNNFAVMSNISPDYAPTGKSTMVATTTGVNTTEDDMRAVLSDWFGNQVESWQTLAIHRIPKAQPVLTHRSERKLAMKTSDGVFVAGDHLADASINGALESGQAAARLCAQTL